MDIDPNNNQNQANQHDNCSQSSRKLTTAQQVVIDRCVQNQHDRRKKRYTPVECIICNVFTVEENILKHFQNASKRERKRKQQIKHDITLAVKFYRLNLRGYRITQSNSLQATLDGNIIIQSFNYNSIKKGSTNIIDETGRLTNIQKQPTTNANVIEQTDSDSSTDIDSEDSDLKVLDEIDFPSQLNINKTHQLIHKQQQEPKSSTQSTIESLHDKLKRCEEAESVITNDQALKQMKIRKLEIELEISKSNIEHILDLSLKFGCFGIELIPVQVKPELFQKVVKKQLSHLDESIIATIPRDDDGNYLFYFLYCKYCSCEQIITGYTNMARISIIFRRMEKIKSKIIMHRKTSMHENNVGDNNMQHKSNKAKETMKRMLRCLVRMIDCNKGDNQWTAKIAYLILQGVDMGNRFHSRKAIPRFEEHVAKFVCLIYVVFDIKLSAFNNNKFLFFGCV